MASATDRPDILLVSGAWHLPDYWGEVRSRLEKAGYQVHVPKLQTICQDDTVRNSWKADVSMILDTVVPLFDQGRQVLAVGHSYGGFAMTPAVVGQTVPERMSRGLKGGFSSVVFLASFAFWEPNGSIISVSGGQYAPWADAGAEVGKGEKSVVRIRPELQPFYNDLEPEAANFWTSKLLPQSQLSMEDPSPVCANDITIPMTYLMCQEDRTVPIQFQEIMAQQVPAMKTVRCKAGHCPMLSQPEETVEVILEAATGGVGSS